MKSSELLREARKLVAKDHPKYICFAMCRVLGISAGSTCIPSADYAAARARPDIPEVFFNIVEATGGGSVDFWLMENCREFKTWQTAPMKQGTARGEEIYEKIMLDYRLRWIDWLIPQYEAKGD